MLQHNTAVKRFTANNRHVCLRENTELKMKWQEEYKVHQLCVL